MIDPVIEEHFRRSLGADYMNLYSNNKKNNVTKMSTSPVATAAKIHVLPSTLLMVATPSPPLSVSPSPPSPSPPSLGASQKTPPRTVSPPTTSVVVVERHQDDPTAGMSVDDHFAKALGGDTWKQLQRADSKTEDTIRQCVKN